MVLFLYFAVLPKFKVTVELPPFVVEGTKEVKGKVISK